MVYNNHKYRRTIFRKLPFGARYFLATNTATSPFIKAGRHSRNAGYLGGVVTTVADASVKVVELDPNVIGSHAAP